MSSIHGEPLTLLSFTNLFLSIMQQLFLVLILPKKISSGIFLIKKNNPNFFVIPSESKMGKDLHSSWCTTWLFFKRFQKCDGSRPQLSVLNMKKLTMSRKRTTKLVKNIICMFLCKRFKKCKWQSKIKESNLNYSQTIRQAT